MLKKYLLPFTAFLVITIAALSMQTLHAQDTSQNSNSVSSEIPKFLENYPFSDPNIMLAEGFAAYDGLLRDQPGDIHYGIDYVLYEDEKFKKFDVFTMHGGQAFQGNSPSWGKYVVVEIEVHGKMFQTIYAHLTEINPEIPSSGRKEVSAAFKLGKADTTGITNGIPQLHIELLEKTGNTFKKLDPYGIYKRRSSGFYPGVGGSLEKFPHYWVTDTPPLVGS